MIEWGISIVLLLLIVGLIHEMTGGRRSPLVPASYSVVHVYLDVNDPFFRNYVWLVTYSMGKPDHETTVNQTWVGEWSFREYNAAHMAMIRVKALQKQAIRVEINGSTHAENIREPG